MWTFASRSGWRKDFGVGLALFVLIFAAQPLVARADDPTPRERGRGARPPLSLVAMTPGTVVRIKPLPEAHNDGYI